MTSPRPVDVSTIPNPYELYGSSPANETIGAPATQVDTFRIEPPAAAPATRRTCTSNVGANVGGLIGACLGGGLAATAFYFGMKSQLDSCVHENCNDVPFPPYACGPDNDDACSTLQACYDAVRHIPFGAPSFSCGVGGNWIAFAVLLGLAATAIAAATVHGTIASVTRGLATRRNAGAGVAADGRV